MQGLSVSLHAQLHLLSLPFLALDYVQRNANRAKEKKKTNRHSCCQLPHAFCIGIMWELVHCHQTLGKNMCTLRIHASKNVTICCLISLEIFTQWKIHHKAVIIVSIVFFSNNVFKDSIVCACFKDTSRKMARVYTDCLSCIHYVLWKAHFATDDIIDVTWNLVLQKSQLSIYHS